MRNLSKFIYTRLLGWKLVGVFPTDPKYIVAVVPHTSWLDFLLGFWLEVFPVKASILLEKRSYLPR